MTASDRWVILTIQLVREDNGMITATDNVSGARSRGWSLPWVMAGLAQNIEAQYLDLAGLTETWPHQERARARLARFFEETP